MVAKQEVTAARPAVNSIRRALGNATLDWYGRRADNVARLRRWSFAALSLSGFVLLWALIVYLEVFPSALFPSPWQVLRAGQGLVLDGSLWTDTAASLRRVAQGFALGGLVAIAIGTLTARIRGVRLALEPLLRLLSPIPTIALVPLAILWFGLGEDSKLFLVGIGVFFPVWISTHAGVASTPADFLKVCECLGASRLRVLRDVVLPEALPDIVAGLRVGVATAFILIVASELSGTTEGLGYRLQQAQTFSQADQLFFCLGVLGLVGALSDRVLYVVTAPLTAWARAAQ